MNFDNPFVDPEIAAAYEAWYITKGKKAADAEKALLKSIIAQFHNAQTILEVGCGTGYFTSWFAELGLRAAGLDHSKPIIREAYENHHFPIIQGDAIALPFQKQSFDLVALITSLEFIALPDQALIEAIRVSRQGLILGVINKFSLLGRRYRKKGGAIWGKARLFSPGELINMLKPIVPKNSRIKYKTTLLPLFPGASKLPWGGFIGLAVFPEGQEKVS
jgi:ubiquinone/menaquinone biosynthesis C-methylase UbiE